MKFFGYILRNARRNPVRSVLTIASTSISLFLMMMIVTFFTINNDVSASSRVYNRIVVLNSAGFSGLIPIARVNEIGAMDGIAAATPYSWFGGKYGEETMPFAQFGVDPQTFFKVYDNFTIPEAQLKAFQEDLAGCVIGRKLAEDRNFKVGDPLPLKGDLYPCDLKLTIRGIYDGPGESNRRMCLFHWSYLDESVKAVNGGKSAANAGCIVAKCTNGEMMRPLIQKIDANYLNSDNPTRTQTEEAFGKMFTEMLGDLKGMMQWVGAAVLFSLFCVAGNAMAMALRERTTEVAVLKAIGFGKQLVLFLILAEAMIVSGIGGIIGSIGCKLFCDYVDISRFTAGFLPFFFVAWSTALLGLAVSLLIGFLSGVVPAFNASRLSVIKGLRKVV